MSATRPASELSMGIIARSAAPFSTAAKTSSNDAQATASQWGYCWVQSRWELEPGSPW